MNAGKYTRATFLFPDEDCSFWREPSVGREPLGEPPLLPPPHPLTRFSPGQAGWVGVLPTAFLLPRGFLPVSRQRASHARQTAPHQRVLFLSSSAGPTHTDPSTLDTAPSTAQSIQHNPIHLNLYLNIILEILYWIIFEILIKFTIIVLIIDPFNTRKSKHIHRNECPSCMLMLIF